MIMEGQNPAKAAEHIENVPQFPHANARKVPKRDRVRAKSATDVKREQAMEAFLDVISKGYSITFAARKAGVDRKTPSNWAAAYPDFAERWADAQAAGADTVEDIIRAAAPNDWRAAAAIREAQANGGWGKRAAASVTVNNNTTTNVVAAEAQITVPGPDTAWLAGLLDVGGEEAADPLSGSERPLLPAGLPAAAA